MQTYSNLLAQTCMITRLSVSACTPRGMLLRPPSGPQDKGAHGAAWVVQTTTSWPWTMLTRLVAKPCDTRCGRLHARGDEEAYVRGKPAASPPQSRSDSVWPAVSNTGRTDPLALSQALPVGGRWNALPMQVWTPRRHLQHAESPSSYCICLSACLSIIGRGAESPSSHCVGACLPACLLWEGVPVFWVWGCVSPGHLCCERVWLPGPFAALPQDSVARYKASLRSSMLYGKNHSTGFNILTGEPGWRPPEVRAPWETQRTTPDGHWQWLRQRGGGGGRKVCLLWTLLCCLCITPQPSR